MRSTLFRDGGDARAGLGPLLLVLALAASAWISPAAAATVDPATAGHHTLWEVHGRHNTVYLLGSVHMLRPEDSRLPMEAVRAYARSRVLVMELDFNHLPTDRLRDSNAALELLPADQTLEQTIGEQLYSNFMQHAQPLGITAAMVARAQPWFAALMLEQQQLAKSGFQSGAGIDEQVARRAKLDRKPIIGLETVDEQLGFFAQMTIAQQSDYMRSIIEDIDTDPEETDDMVHAWQHGDVDKLTELLMEDSQESPELFHVLTTERNQRWLPRIRDLLNQGSDCLVVVGALHLVGPDGLVALLRAQGFKAVQD
jgi:uncharacterized protein YbaP (TraB family)